MARIGRYPTPLHLLIVVMVSIFAAEAAVMLLLHVLPDLPTAIVTVLDAFLLSMMAFPVLYLLMYRPLALQIVLREKVEDDLRKQRDNLEEMVENRVSRIRQINNELQEEVKRHRQVEEYVRRVNILQADIMCPGTVEDKLGKITEGIVDIFNADFCRIWISRPGDICDSGCIHGARADASDKCIDREQCLHLVSSAGRYTHIDGDHRRVPFGAYKIGLIATDEQHKLLTNDVTHDPRVHNQDWARQLELVSFAGYAIRPPNKGTIGVLALFAGHRLSADEDAVLESLAHLVGQIIENSRVEQEQRLLQARLREAQKLKALGTLAGGIAHDFNNILGAIIGFADMAKDDVPRGTVARENLAEVLTAARRAKDLISQILAFSRAGRAKPVPVQIDAVVEEALAMLRGALPAHIEIFREIDCTSVLLADETQIHQVLINLCKNAADAMEDTGGILRVSVAEVDVDRDCSIRHAPLQTGPHVRITVEDTGCGMSRQVQQRIFEPFYTTKEVGKGTGMGLSVVHGIVSSYGGAIAVESTPGEGSRFDVFLPVAENARVPDTEEIVL